MRTKFTVPISDNGYNMTNFSQWILDNEFNEVSGPEWKVTVKHRIQFTFRIFVLTITGNKKLQV